MTTTTTRTEARGSRLFESHPSLSASLEDFEHHDKNSPKVIRIPSHRSGFHEESSEPGTDSDQLQYSPAFFRPTMSSHTSGWYRHQPYDGSSPLRLSPDARLNSRERSFLRASATFDDDDPTLPINIPLPQGSMSPTKSYFTPSPSPEARFTSAPPAPQAPVPAAVTIPDAHDDETSGSRPNYIRFSLRADMQQRTDAIDIFTSWLSKRFKNATRTRTSLFSTVFGIIIGMLILQFITRTPRHTPFPDLVKLSGLTRSFEPMIYFSENGVGQIAELQETEVAVWDLGESVRNANMTSAPIIVEELEGLSGSLKGLASELTNFYASVDGDIDNILIVLDWAKRELGQLGGIPSSITSSMIQNLYNVFSLIGLLADPQNPHSVPGYFEVALSWILGKTPAQYTRSTLDYAFGEVLQTLEGSINSELVQTAALFQLFGQIDQQFLNLQRATVRELDVQERLEQDVLSSLWVRTVGGFGTSLKKYERNKKLLQSLRERTVTNKNILLEHNGRLMAIKSSLELLRRRLAGPLFRGSGQGSMMSIEGQIEGIQDTHQYLKQVREQQRERVWEELYGGLRRAKRTMIGIEAAKSKKESV